MDSTSRPADAPAQAQPCPLTQGEALADLADDVNAVGDWAVFKRRCAFLDATPVLVPQQGIDVKRQYALAYLGERAQLHGGVFRATRPTVFTESVIVALCKRNTTVRFARYPWLAQMVALLTALDDAQYNVMNQDGNVLAFPEGYSTRSGSPQLG